MELENYHRVFLLFVIIDWKKKVGDERGDSQLFVDSEKLSYEWPESSIIDGGTCKYEW